MCAPKNPIQGKLSENKRFFFELSKYDSKLFEYSYNIYLPKIQSRPKMSIYIPVFTFELVIYGRVLGKSTPKIARLV